MIEEGKPAPDFELATDTGERVKLSDYRGQPVVLYFYPKDDTPGCTVEACGFRDSYTDFEKRGAVVLGVSPDDVASHVKFKNKFSLPYPLLADPEHEVAEQYGVWGEKKFAGKTYVGRQAIDVRDRCGRKRRQGDAQREAGRPSGAGARSASLLSIGRC